MIMKIGEGASMNAATVQMLFDNAFRSQGGWKMKANQLFKCGVHILELAKSAQEESHSMANAGSHEVTPAEARAFETYRLYDVGLFLIALAMENLVKGIWAGRHHSLLQSLKNARKDLEGLVDHDLANVAKNSGINLSVEEEALLKAISEIIVWYGRYHVPVRIDQYHRVLSEGPPSNRFLTGKHITTMELPLPSEIGRFFEKLLLELETIPQEQRY
jgi:hypothetical protein